MLKALWVITATTFLGGYCAGLTALPFGQRHPNLVRATVWIVWGATGALALAAVVLAATRLIHGGGLARDQAGDAVVVICVGTIAFATMVCLLGLFGFWSAIGRLIRRGTGRLSVSSETARKGLR
ncbi:hypothetical protein [Mycobacteroides abscessus]|uniref:hypothetical protein n=1 Tax=Mycobacteroides abscessus TaxID=36809 RepID=UPI0009A7A974|nr:hypothetical protein [Mycobacteroides abscessus]SLH41303.1 Uncharacterised protein [Mycobacteroides abscessus subsp. massiliense]